MAKSRAPKPEPIPVNVVCSLCGEAWASHQATDGEVTTLECIRLLKAARNRVGPVVIPRPYPVYPSYPWITYTQGGSIGQTVTTTTGVTFNAASTRPKVLTASAAL